MAIGSDIRIGSRAARRPGKVDDVHSFTGFFTSAKCIDVDGANEYVDMGSSAHNFERTDPFSMSIWFKTTATSGTHHPICKRGHSDSLRRGYSIAYRPGSSEWVVILAHDDISNNDIDKRYNLTGTENNGSWHHVILTYDGSSDASGVNLYVDGSLLSLKVLNSNNLTATMQSTNVFAIGGRNGGDRFWSGRLDEATIWDVELSSSEITELYNSGTPFDPNTHSQAANLLSWWPLGDGDTYPTLLDNKGSFDGTMTNMEAGDIVNDSPP